MELLYNPDAMPVAELKATFIGREALLRDLIELVHSQPQGAGVQHAMIIAPRGMGKTSVLQIFRHALLESEMATHWLPLKFPEELYGVADLADFWLETVRLLAIETNTVALNETAQQLPRRYQKRGDIAEAALALLRDFKRKSGKRLLLQVENLDTIFENFNEQETASLRATLMNDGSVMLLGSAVKFFEQARAYDQPLYNFFKLFNLHPLSFEESQKLLARRGERDGLEQFTQMLEEHSARLHVLHHFTQGIPRLVLMLYRVLAQSDINLVRQALEKLLDDVTPYYKARIDALPAQQRKVLEYIARAVAKTHEGVSPTEIANSIGLSVNQVSSQMKRLVEAGFLHRAPLRGRSSYYLLSEPLYSLWHQMRLNPETRTRKLVWLVEFLRDWYDDQERLAEAERLYQLYDDSFRLGNRQQAVSFVEHLHVLAQSALATPVAGKVLSKATRSLLKLRGKSIEVGGTDSDRLLSEQLTDIEAELARNPKDADCWNAKGYILMWEKNEYEHALQCIEHALESDLSNGLFWGNRAVALDNLKRYAEALDAYEKAILYEPDNAIYWNNRGITLRNMQRYKDAIYSYKKTLDLDPRYYRYNASFPLVFIEDCFVNAVCFSNLKEAFIAWEILNLIPDEVAKRKTLKRDILLSVELNHLEFARELIKSSKLGEEFFLLDRAIEYLMVRDEALLDKLSPEVRNAVRPLINDIDISLSVRKDPKKYPLTQVRLAIDDDYIAQRGFLVHKLKAKDSTKRWAYYFVLVLEPMEKTFLRALDSDKSIELESYGRVLASNYGEEPNKNTKLFLKEKYGFKV